MVIIKTQSKFTPYVAQTLEMHRFILCGEKKPLYNQFIDLASKSHEVQVTKQKLKFLKIYIYLCLRQNVRW